MILTDEYLRLMDGYLGILQSIITTKIHHLFLAIKSLIMFICISIFCRLPLTTVSKIKPHVKAKKPAKKRKKLSIRDGNLGTNPEFKKSIKIGKKIKNPIKTNKDEIMVKNGNGL